ncbi:hypothetical protein GCM10025767_11790 [Thalassotalea piscium]|uniref:Uncharacterized protein n=1 Tax=Thalassotalea piscium TaxID=1230533 RepID=A0A7X0TSH1_9GAMM|nr:hypothetical protein [Thalassotalea piscium]
MKINALYLTVFTAYKIDHIFNETGIIKINALYLTVFTAYKIDHLLNETGITCVISLLYKVNYFCSISLC